MLFWRVLWRPLSICRLSSRAGSLAVAVIGAVLAVWGGVTRYYGISDFTSFLSFELSYAQANFSQSATVSACEDLFGQPDDLQIHGWLMEAQPFYLAAYSTYLLFTFLSSWALFYGAWTYNESFITPWLTVRSVATLAPGVGNVLYALCYGCHQPLAAFIFTASFSLQLFSLWTVFDLYLLIQGARMDSIHQTVDVSPADLINRQDRNSLPLIAYY